MKKICFITTISGTLRSFVVGTAEFLHRKAGYDITFICDNDDAFAASLPPYMHYIPIPMKRGVSLGGIGAMLKMVKVFRRERFDMVQYSTPNASLYAALAAAIARIPIRKYHLMGFRYLGFTGLKKNIFKRIEIITCALSTDVECVSFSNRTLGVKEGIFLPQKSNVILHGSSSGVNLTQFDFQKKEMWRNELRRQFGYGEHDCVFG